MKKEVMIFLSSILLLPFISAQLFGGNSIADVFSFIDPQTIFLLVAFGVLGILLSTILNTYPAFRGATAGMISIILSLGMTYGINKWVNINEIFMGMGISGDIMMYLIAALFIIFIISLFIFKWKAFLITGLLLIGISFTDLVYEQDAVLIAGIIFTIIGLIWWWKSRKNIMPGSLPSGKKTNWCLLLIIAGLIVGAYGLYLEVPAAMGIGLVILVLGILCWWRKNKKKALAGQSFSPNSVNPGIADAKFRDIQEQQKAIYQQRQRSLYDLKQKYMAYLFAYNKRGLTKQYRTRILQAMNIIIDYARKVGVSKGDFLSNKIGGSNAKAPEDLRPPFDG